MHVRNKKNFNSRKPFRKLNLEIETFKFTLKMLDSSYYVAEISTLLFVISDPYI
jgi:hypothetical protein